MVQDGAKIIQEEKPLILVVEDTQEIREGIKSLLELEGYRVYEAADGKEALELLKRDPLPQLIISDLIMPHVNGWHLVEALADDDRLSNIPVIILTAFPKTARVVRCQEIIRKPFDVDKLLSALRRFGLSS